MSHVSYASEFGSLMYEMVCNRLYFTHAVGVLRRYMSKPRKAQWIVVKRVFNCLALLVMDCATKEDQYWTECWAYMGGLMQIGI